tara:strand:- start:736 stop:1251 length:516 start_codon:yes stop_codon:yes gene_type:complete
MATLIIPNEFDDGDVISASEMNANFNAVKTLINTTKLDLENIENDHHIVNHSFYHHASISDEGYVVFRFQTYCPNGVLIPKQLSISGLIAAGTMDVQVYENPSSVSNPADNNIMSSVSSTSTDYTPHAVTAFSDTSIANNTPMAIKVLANGGALSQVCVTLSFLAKHVDTD